MKKDGTLDSLRQDLSNLFKHIHEVRYEIAAIHRPADQEHSLDRAGDQLQAIVAATEQSSFAIMDAMEKNEALVGKLRGVTKEAAATALLDEISNNNMAVFEACSFQDITGQRITKVVATLRYIEDRIEALIKIWGKPGLDSVEVQPTKEKTKDEQLLNGPQLKDEGISQADIDKLFG